MHKLNLPLAQLDIVENEGKSYVFDIIRKKNILLTPEEWVRQNFLHFLIYSLHYPTSLCALERGLKYNKLYKRSDITVYDRLGNVFMVIECKAIHIKISQSTFEQAANYCYVLKSSYMVVTNGLQHYCCKLDYENKTYHFIENLPTF